VELNEAVLRILRHARLVVLVVLLCLAIPFVGAWRGEDAYRATSRVTFGAEPVNEDEAAAMVDTARAIITTPGEIEAVLGRQAGDRDPADVEERVEVDSVGVSAVLTISVSDADPRVAAAVANGLSRQFLAARRALVLDSLEERLAGVDRQLAMVREDIGAITRSGSELEAVIDTRRLQLDAALSRQSGLRAERERLNTALDGTPKPALLARATVPEDPEPSGLAADVVVAGLLGLMIGVGIAAVCEALRPTVAGSRALEAALGAPILGRIPDPAATEADIGDSRIALPFALAAQRAEVDIVHLAGVGPPVDLGPLADQLGAGAPELTVDTIGASSEAAAPRRRRTDTVDEGLVVVAPEVQPRSALSDVERLLGVSRWPLLGIITYPSPIWRRHTGRGRVRSGLHQAGAAFAAAVGGGRRRARHPGLSSGPRPVALLAPRLRRFIRAPWGPEKP